MKWLKRLYDLINKLTSVKGFVFLTACGLLAFGKMDTWTWLISSAILIGFRYFEKLTLTNKDNNADSKN